jgi:hypothetical protein
VLLHFMGAPLENDAKEARRLVRMIHAREIHTLIRA